MRHAVAYLRRHHIGLLALAIALTGTAYASHKIGTRDIARNAVKAPQLSASAVGSKQGVIRTKLIKINDPVGPPSTSKVLIKRGPFKLTAFCQDYSATVSDSALEISTQVRAWVVGSADSTSYMPAGDTDTVYSPVGPGGEGAESEAVFIVDGHGRFLDVGVHVARKPLGENVDCAYTVVGFSR